MNIKTWAEREIEIACKRERADSKVEDGNWDYGCACYESALKAYKSLMGDGHSGFSIGLTKQILNRLIEGKPLTSIEDTDDIWNDLSRFGDGDDKYTSYQCKRMSSLFKYVYADGTIKYKDIDGHYCINVDNPNSTYHSGLVQRIIDEMFPITMPYFPRKPIKVYCEDFLVDKRNGDFDTQGVFYLVKSDGERMEINRFFKSTEDGWDEIDHAEYLKRKSIRIKGGRRMLEKLRKLQAAYEGLKEYEFYGNISSWCYQFSMAGLIKISEETGRAIEYKIKNVKDNSYPIEGKIKIENLTLIAVTDYEEAKKLKIEIIPQLAKIAALKKELKELEEAINV